VSDIDELFKMLDEKEQNVDQIRQDILNLILEQLTINSDGFGYWEKFHFANAIANLAHNLAYSNKDTTAWLRLCLVNIEKGLVPANRRSESGAGRNDEIDALTIDDLRVVVKKLGGIS